MKISIITVVYNGELYIEDCIKSVIEQDYKQIEYIVVDGGSTDGTLSIIEKYQTHVAHFISEIDKGIYDGINKGIALATGEVIGLLNADDRLASNTVISEIVSHFEITKADAIYGNLNYVNPLNINQIVRKWVAKQFVKKDMEIGWMPAHPTLYIKTIFFKTYGGYSLNYGTAADYELMLRFLYQFNLNALYLNRLIVNMRIGGVSNASLKQRYLAFLNDYKAAKTNHIPFPLFAIIIKKVSKFSQFFG